MSRIIKAGETYISAELIEQEGVVSFKEKNIKVAKDTLLLGTPGIGRCYHPWDNLKSCACGGSPWMEGKNGGNFEEGEPYKIRCCKCGKRTKDGAIQDIKNEWNNVLAEKKPQIVVIDQENEYEELTEILGGKVIHLTPIDTNSCYFNPLELSKPHITNEDIINTVENIIKIRKTLNPSNRDETKDVLEAVCLKNNLTLSDECKVQILSAVQNNLNN